MILLPHSYILMAFIVLLAIINSVFAQVSSESFVPCQEMPTIMHRYQADRAAINRFYSPSTNAPRYRFDQDLGSPDKRMRLKELNEHYLDRLAKFNFKDLAQECKVDYILFKRDLEENIRKADKEDQMLQSLEAWFPFSDKLFDWERFRRRGTPLDAPQVAAFFSDMAQSIPSLQQHLAGGKFTPEEIHYALETIELLKKTAKSIVDFYHGYDPLFTWWVPESYHRADSVLDDYAKAFAGKQEPNSMGTYTRAPVGREELSRLLQVEMVNYTPEELLAIAEKELAWCREEMLNAANQMGYGNDWKAALEKVKESAVPPGRQPEAILKLYQESVDFIKQHDLITIPPLAEETWGMIMMTPERQKSNAFFTGGWEISISYPTNTMDYDLAQMRMLGNNPYFSRATVHHELIAGHNLEFFMNARNRSYRNFDTPFWMEGWALYWEMLLWDKGFARTPEEKMGMLFWRKYRCARVIFQLNFHLRKWSPETCADFLVEEVGHERANVESELNWPLSRDSQAFPLYQVSYYIGGLQFYALQREALKGEKMTEKTFHDTVMQLNAMPVEMIRAILLEKPLNQKYRTRWKFYN